MAMSSSSRIVGNRVRAAGLVAAGLLTWAAAGTAAAQEIRPAPPFEGKSIPEPPEQGKPWKAPETRLPRFLATATDALFQQGVADPRGCEYREVEIAYGHIVKIHAFVIPERADVAGRFVVGWNGLVYPALTVGEPADLDSDVRELAEAIRKTPENQRGGRFPAVGARSIFYSAGDFDGGAGADSRGAIKLCMLLRLGRADLAEAIFAAGTTWTSEPRGRDLTDYGITYQTLAVDWASSGFMRLISAHVRGDDVIALDAARKLAKFRDLATARMDEMGFPQGAQQGGYFPSNGGAPNGPPPRFPFLGQLDALLADHERRAAMPPRTPVPPKGGDPAARVAALIRDMDQIDVQQMSNPGAAHPGSSYPVKFLIEEGDPAVEPLLKALESDERLTRSVSHGRSAMDISSYVHPVGEAVFSALVGILKTNEFESQRTYGWNTPTQASRKSLAEAMRQYWERNRTTPLAERWYKLLLDDAAGPSRWLEAAGGIVSPDSPPGFPAKPGTLPGRGEPLRDGRTPSVTELMIRRTRDTVRAGDRTGEYGRSGIIGACTLASALSTWDEKASLPLLQELSRQCREAMERWQSQYGSPQPDRSLIIRLAEFTTIRARLGDAGAFDDYADWLRTTTPKILEYNTDAAFKPLVDNPNQPALAKAAQRLFADPASPWLPILPEARGEQPDSHRDICSSALLVLPVFRGAVINGLADRTPLGTVSRSPEGHMVRKMKNGSTTTSGSTLVEEKEGIAPGVEQDLRSCDLLASNISKVAGAPRVELLWPEERRNQAVAACVEFLKRYGPHFEATNSPNSFDPAVRVRFPSLGRPATKEDVAAGRAIFALEGESRTVNILPGLPQEGRWTTLKDAPYQVNSGNGRSEIQYQDDGRIWQAEEVREGDHWVRYYGFVGRHTIGRAPASEIEFGPRYGPMIRLPGGLNARLEVPRPTPSSFRFEPGQPIPLVMHLQNRLGVDTTCPTEFVQPAPDGKPALRKGITLRIFRSKLASPSAARGQQQGVDETEPAKRLADFEPTGASRVLGPAESFEAMRIDVNDWFDLSAPGRYSVTAVVAPESGLGEATIRGYTFQVGGEP